MDKGENAGNPDLEMPQIWVFSKRTNLLAPLSRLKIHGIFRVKKQEIIVICRIDFVFQQKK